MTNGNWTDGRDGFIPFLYSTNKAVANGSYVGGFIVCPIIEEQSFYSRKDRPFFINSGYDYIAFYKASKTYYAETEKIK